MTLCYYWELFKIQKCFFIYLKFLSFSPPKKKKKVSHKMFTYRHIQTKVSRKMHVKLHWLHGHLLFPLHFTQKSIFSAQLAVIRELLFLLSFSWLLICSLAVLEGQDLGVPHFWMSNKGTKHWWNVLEESEVALCGGV